MWEFAFKNGQGKTLFKVYLVVGIGMTRVVKMEKKPTPKPFVWSKLYQLGCFWLQVEIQLKWISN